MNMWMSLLLSSLALLPAPTAGPAGSPPAPETVDPTFYELTHFADLAEVFNRDKGHVRLVTLLSPSCGYCIKGYRYLRKLLDEVDDDRLRMYVVWEPMLSGDSKELAERMSRKADDPRVVYQAWDEARITGEAWQKTLDLRGIAWDVYFLYDDAAAWTGDAPTPPAYWQHQGQSETADVLDYERLKTKVEAMLAQAD